MMNKKEYETNDLEFLYFIGTKTHYDKRDNFNNYLKEAILIRVPVIKETRKS